MRTRLLSLGLLAAVTQLFATGCFHLVSRYREHHQFQPFHSRGSGCGPCDECGSCFSAQRPISMHGAFAGPTGGPVGAAPCNCGDAPGVTVGLHGPTVTPVTNPPGIGYPIPLNPGPTVVPQPLPAPMPFPDNKGIGKIN